jgi:hypothetical protein
MPSSLFSAREILDAMVRRDPMSDATHTPFPPEQTSAQAQGNAAAWILTMIAYLKERGSAVEDCVAYHGRCFAPVWEGVRGRPVEEVAQMVALNALSVGLRYARYRAKTIPPCPIIRRFALSFASPFGMVSRSSG